MNSNFENAVSFVIENEKGFSNNPLDSGGATNYGITQAELSAWRGYSVSIDDVKNMPQSEGRAIYFMRYWQPLCCDKISDRAIATSILDSGVLYGIFSAAIAAQSALNSSGFPTLTLDGHIGPETLNALNTVDAHTFILAFNTAIKNRIATIITRYPKNAVFVQGWTARADKLLTLA